MRRGDLYRVSRAGRASSGDPRDHRVFVVVSRQVLLDSRFSTVICAPVYSRFEGLSTQLEVGPEEGIKHASAAFCDELVSIERSRLTEFVGSLSAEKARRLSGCLRTAVGAD